jgi:hypothetical protein
MLHNNNLFSMKNKTMLLALLAASCILVQSVSAQYPSWNVLWDPQALAQFLFPGMDPQWLRIPDVLYYVILPFIAAFTVIYGLLRELRIFRHAPNKVNVILAFCMAFLLLPSGIITLLVTILYAGGAALGMIAFGILFIIGIVLWFYGTTARLWDEYSPKALAGAIKDYDNEYRQLQKEWSQLEQQRLSVPGASPQAQNLARRIGLVQNQMTKILEQKANAVNVLKSQTQ